METAKAFELVVTVDENEDLVYKRRGDETHFLPVIIFILLELMDAMDMDTKMKLIASLTEESGITKHVVQQLEEQTKEKEGLDTESVM